MGWRKFWLSQESLQRMTEELPCVLFITRADVSFVASLGFCRSEASWIQYALLFGQITVCFSLMLGTKGRMPAPPVKPLYFEGMKKKNAVQKQEMKRV